jgi:glutaredoxin-like protein NrdH
VIVTVYSKPKCTACDATKRLLTKLQIPHSVIDITEDPNALAYVKSLGYLGAPVVIAEAPSGVQHWAEYREGRIRAIAQEFADDVRTDVADSGIDNNLRYSPND